MKQEVQTALALEGERRITRRQALLWVLFRLDSEGKERKKDVSSPNDAWLIGWDDEPGDPLFICVGEKFRAVKRHVAARMARDFVMSKLDEDPGEPKYFIEPVDD